MFPDTLETDSLVLKPLSPEYVDLLDLYDLFADGSDDAADVFEYVPQEPFSTPKDARDWLRGAAEEWDEGSHAKYAVYVGGEHGNDESEDGEDEASEREDDEREDGAHEDGEAETSQREHGEGEHEDGEHEDGEREDGEGKYGDGEDAGDEGGDDEDEDDEDEDGDDEHGDDEHGETLAGVAALSPAWDRRRASLAVILGKPHGGRGYAGECATALAEVAFDRLDHEVVTLGYDEGNDRSRRAIETLVDRFGGQYDGSIRNATPRGDEVADAHDYSVTREQWRDVGGDA